MEDYNELLTKYALNSDNYKGWRKTHTGMFGRIFSHAFSENAEAQIHLTAALINISNRNFEGAMPKLDVLKDMCASDYDHAAVNYFTGLNYEMLGNESEMNKHYEKLKETDVSFVFPLPFHPYYRTAKFAQRDSECNKAISYYRKAVMIYDGMTPNKQINASVSHILYDIATVYLYMHNYSECERFLQLSVNYDSDVNSHRTYVTALLYAVRGEKDECRRLMSGLNDFLRENCEPMAEAILAGKDLHYCAVPQDRRGYADFWNYIVAHQTEIKSLVYGGKTDKAENIISDKLSSALAFMKRRIACKIEERDGVITVHCKNYYVKTLAAEYEALFAQKPDALNGWSFVSQDQLEKY